jgi:hypothetical protein
MPMNLHPRSVALAVALACACTGSIAIEPPPGPAAGHGQAGPHADSVASHASHLLAPLSPVAEPRPRTMLLAGLVALVCLMRLKRGARR